MITRYCDFVVVFVQTQTGGPAHASAADAGIYASDGIHTSRKGYGLFAIAG